MLDGEPGALSLASSQVGYIAINSSRSASAIFIHSFAIPHFIIKLEFFLPMVLCSKSGGTYTLATLGSGAGKILRRSATSGECGLNSVNPGTPISPG